MRDRQDGTFHCIAVASVRQEPSGLHQPRRLLPPCRGQAGHAGWWLQGGLCGSQKDTQASPPGH